MNFLYELFVHALKTVCFVFSALNCLRCLQQLFFFSILLYTVSFMIIFLIFYFIFRVFFTIFQSFFNFRPFFVLIVFLSMLKKFDVFFVCMQVLFVSLCPKIDFALTQLSVTYHFFTNAGVKAFVSGRLFQSFNFFQFLQRP